MLTYKEINTIKDFKDLNNNSSNLYKIIIELSLIKIKNKKLEKKLEHIIDKLSLSYYEIENFINDYKENKTNNKILNNNLSNLTIDDILML